MPGFSRRTLGRTGLEVSPIGIGGGSMISSEDLLYAFERGVNYYFFSSDMHHFFYRRSVDALRSLCGRGSAVREKVVLATVSYVNDPEKIPGVLVDQFTELDIDYIDVFHWGWITDSSDCASLFEASASLKQDGEMAEWLRSMFPRAAEVNEELRRRGLVRFVGASFHSRAAARRSIGSPLDVLMLRYNVAHLGAEADVFPGLSGDKRKDPGIVAFNVGHEGPRYLHTAPPNYPPGYPVPTIPDCYRFALSNPFVDVVLTGVKDRAELDAALASLEKGPLSERELRFMRKYGTLFSNEAARVRVPEPGREPPAAVDAS